MIKTIKDAKKNAKIYNAIETNKERLEFLKANNEIFKIVLDNDCTMVSFIIDDNDDDSYEALGNIELNSFDNYYGCNNELIELFEFIGITAECC